MGIDSREIRLGKWYIPKNVRADKSENNHNVYHVLGYFDNMEIKEIKRTEGNNHFLAEAYRQSYRQESYESPASSQREFFVQEIKIFTNVSESSEAGFSESYIKEFWDDDSAILCFSMLQLYLNENVEKIVDKIKKTFASANYIYYFTFDYSGIVIFAKNMTIKAYTEALFKINYKDENDAKQVKDTFSIYGIQKAKLNTIFLQFSEPDWEKQNILDIFGDTYEYEAAVNISVKYLSTFSVIYEELNRNERKLGSKSEVFKLSGRHDISIVNKSADMAWLLYVQYLLDKYTNQFKDTIYAYESFIKVKGIEDYERKPHDYNTIYENAVKRLLNICKTFSEKAKESGYSSYCIPVYEVCNSIISILKNGFAEDFVICMYQPFCEFLEYLVRKMEEQNNSEKRRHDIQYSREFDKCFCLYFDSLNSLVNSAMHTDRQFIHATSFGAIYYDVPPKIMAFYVAVIYKFRMIMQTKKEQHYKYTFLMSPSFSDEIKVKIISYDEKAGMMPVDRILRVSINERSLYNPRVVIRRMAHELAHYVGGELRERSFRKEMIIDTLVYSILFQILHSDFAVNKYFWKLNDKISGRIKDNLFFYIKDRNYSYDLQYLHEDILSFFIRNSEVHREIREYVLGEIEGTIKEGRCGYFSKIMERELEARGISVINGGIDKDPKLTEIQKVFLCNLVMEDIRKELIRLSGKPGADDSLVYSLGGTFLEKYGTLKNYTRTLISLYSETYADLQMILLLGISYEDYLLGFVEDEMMDVEKMKNNNEDMNRIAVISKLMQEQKKWTCECTKESLSSLHNAVVTRCEAMKVQGNEYELQNENLTKYLEQCLEQGDKYYAGCIKDIDELRDDIQVITDYEDAEKVYSTVCKVISQYREKQICQNDLP